MPKEGHLNIVTSAGQISEWAMISGYQTDATETTKAMLIFHGAIIIRTTIEEKIKVSGQLFVGRLMDVNLE